MAHFMSAARFIGLCLVGTLITLPGLGAHAQDAGQVAKVLKGQSCPGCNLFQAELGYLDLPGVDLSGARLRQADLSLTTLDGANLSGANLSVANAFGTRMNRANLSKANLDQASFVGAWLGGSDLTGASMAGTNLSGAELPGVSGLTQGQLDQACGDAATVLPKGLRIPAC